MRKLLRKHLPTAEGIRGNRWLAPFGAALHHPNLWHLHRRSVAGAVAVGLFCGLVPGPLQMVAAALAALVLRVNLPVAIVMTWYTNPLTIVPLYMLAYRIGALVTGAGSSGPPPALDLVARPVSEWLPALVDWAGHMGEPFLVGLPLLAAMLAATGYLAVRGAWRMHVIVALHRRRRAKISQN